MMGLGLGMGLWSLVGMLIFWAILIAAAIWIIKLLFPAMPQTSDKQPSSPMHETILKVRYARGELSQEQYQKMVRLLHE